VFVPFEGGRPSGKAIDFVTGFLDGDRARGRPVGVAFDGTGALLVADDAGDTVWRVAADGAPAPSPPPRAGREAGAMRAAAVGGHGSRR
jgi:hypothetical protein